jgi:hypothetical protein
VEGLIFHVVRQNTLQICFAFPPKYSRVKGGGYGDDDHSDQARSKAMRLGAFQIQSENITRTFAQNGCRGLGLLH